MLAFLLTLQARVNRCKFYFILCFLVFKACNYSILVFIFISIYFFYSRLYLLLLLLIVNAYTTVTPFAIFAVISPFQFRGQTSVHLSKKHILHILKWSTVIKTGHGSLTECASSMSRVYLCGTKEHVKSWHLVSPWFRESKKI